MVTLKTIRPYTRRIMAARRGHILLIASWRHEAMGYHGILGCLGMSVLPLPHWTYMDIYNIGACMFSVYSGHKCHFID